MTPSGALKADFMFSKLSLLSLLILAGSASADVRYVDANNFSGSNDGTSWGNAFFGPAGLQTALAASSSGDQIWCAEGVYLPTNGTSRGVSIVLKNGVQVYGGFNGTESSFDQRPALGVAPSVLSGDLLDNDASGSVTDNSYHVVKGTSTNATAVLDGFTVSGGNSNASGNNNKGGGILCISNSSPSIRNCLFINNRCTFGGGAGYISGSSPSFIDCTFQDNIGGSYGGAFDIAGGGAVVFDRCAFYGNRAARAGALEIYSTTGPRVTNCVFSGNTATGGGGGGALWIGTGGNTQLRNCTVVGNFSTVNVAAGLRVSGANPSIANCIFWDNVGPGGAQASANQVTGTTAVTYSIVEGGLSGTGNISLTPQFTDLANGDLSLAGSSVGLDAGSNSMVPAGILLDKAHNPRFADAPVSDAGSGTAPIVDIGAYEFTPVQILAFCSGDGSGTPCPCSNVGGSGEGCANTTGSGAVLSGVGSVSVSAADLVLRASQLTQGPGLFFQGNNAVNSGNGNIFGDGLRCAGGGVIRLEVRFANAGNNYTADSTLPVAAAGGASAGQTKRYQYWYRDSGTSPCASLFNLSNGVEVTWAP